VNVISERRRRRRPTLSPWQWIATGLPVSMFVVGPAAAQVGEGLIVQSQIPQPYDRGRNVGVEEQPRPDYSPLGVRLASLIIFPRVEVGAGGTTNTYLTGSDPIAAPILFVRPSARLVSDWSRHLVQVSGAATLRDYVGESPRNERVWNLDASARIDVRRALTVEVEAGTARAFENLFSGEVTSTLAALSRFQRSYGSVQTTYTGARTRAFVVADLTGLQFESVPLREGGVRDQSDRDRRIARITGQLEYARSPSISLFGQLSGSTTRYDRNLLTGGPNLDSKAVRALVGMNLDIAGRVRGTIGIGYGIRDYHASPYRTIRGVSVESRIQAFPLQRLTLTATAQRTIEDATLNRTALWNTRGGLRADYEVLRNLIVNATADLSRQVYIDNPLTANVQRVGIGGRYLSSRRVTLQGALNYNRQSSKADQARNVVGEARFEAGIAYQL
jgi:hypothetical protein